MVVSLAADLHNCRVCESLVENVHLAAQFQGVDDEVFCPGGNLHQACQAQEAPVGMVLKTRDEKHKVGSITEVMLQTKQHSNRRKNSKRGLLKDNWISRFGFCSH